jgi:integrase
MNPKVLQYLMGHADISVTFDTYTHIKVEDAKEEMDRLELLKTMEA